MSIIYIDGFDLYHSTAEIAAGRWNANGLGIIDSGSFPSLIPGRFGGQAVRFTFMGVLVRTLPNLYNTLTIGCSFRYTAQTNCSLLFGNQCKAQIHVDGSISIIANGTIATSAPRLIPPHTWVWLEVQIVFGTVGHFHVWVNGVSVIAGQGNTQTQATPYTDWMGFLIEWNIFEDEMMDIDDVYVSNNVDAPPNNAPNYGQWRIEPRYPCCDTAASQFTPVAPCLGQFDPTIAGTGTNYGASLMLQPVTSAVTGTVTSARLYWKASSLTAKVRCVVYTDDAGSPHTPIGISDEVIGIPSFLSPPGYIAVDYPFSTPPVLLRGRSYWIGFFTDSGVNFDLETVTGSTAYHALNVYAGGAPVNPALTAVTDRQIPMTFSTTTTANYPCINEAACDEDGSYVATTGSAEDIYLIPQWLDVPVNVWAVNVVSVGRKTSEGDTWYQHRLESEWTDWRGKPNAPSTDWRVYVDLLEHDPNTGTFWQGKAVNALRAGFVASQSPTPARIETPGIIPQPLVLP